MRDAPDSQPVAQCRRCHQDVSPLDGDVDSNDRFTCNDCLAEQHGECGEKEEAGAA